MYCSAPFSIDSCGDTVPIITLNAMLLLPLVCMLPLSLGLGHNLVTRFSSFTLYVLTSNPNCRLIMNFLPK